MQLTVGRLETAAMEEKALLLRYAQYRYCPHAYSGMFMYMYMNNCMHSTPEREREQKERQTTCYKRNIYKSLSDLEK